MDETKGCTFKPITNLAERRVSGSELKKHLFQLHQDAEKI